MNPFIIFNEIKRIINVYFHVIIKKSVIILIRRTGASTSPVLPSLNLEFEAKLTRPTGGPTETRDQRPGATPPHRTVSARPLVGQLLWENGKIINIQKKISILLSVLFYPV